MIGAMARRIFITGSTDGLGLAAAQSLLDGGHQVVAHARSASRAEELRARLPGAMDVLVGDLVSREQVLDLAGRANRLGAFDAVIHNAGVGYREPRRILTPEGHAHLLAINVLAPYLLTARMDRPGRLVYTTSGMQTGGDPGLRDVDWVERRWDGVQAYADSKLFDTALALAVARRWPDVPSNAVSPGWVATKMGGAGAPDDLSLAHVTQVWLAVSDDPEATATGRVLHHARPIAAPSAAGDVLFQEALLEVLEQLTGVSLPAA